MVNVTSIEVPEHVMLNVGLDFIGFDSNHIATTKNSKKIEYFCSFYGASPATCSNIFRDIQVLDIGVAKIQEVKVKYFLMALWWLYRYQTEVSILPTFKVKSEFTVRKWTWAYCKAIQALKATKVRIKHPVLA
jgi:hypothetical protein